MMTKVKWPIETNDIDDRFLRDYKNMCKSIEDRQINDFYEAQRHMSCHHSLGATRATLNTQNASS